MRILLDECVNPRLRQAFPDHEVLTVAEATSRALPDAELIAHAQGRCDVLVTADKGFEHEHNLRNLRSGSSSFAFLGTGWNTTDRCSQLWWTQLGAQKPVR